jgi:hypothetical protein
MYAEGVKIQGSNALDRKIQSSLAFRWFILRGFAHSPRRHRNNNTSLEPFSRQQRRNFLTTWIGLRATPHDVQGAAKEKRSCYHHNVCTKKRKTQKNIEVLFWGRLFFFRGISLFATVLGT